MATHDITRLLKADANHYVGSRMQQARPLIDPDLNEGQQAQAHTIQQARRELGGSIGSPDNGFLPELHIGKTIIAKSLKFGRFVTADVLNYDILPGAIHISGQRYCLESNESIVFQRSYLQMGASTAPRAAVGEQLQFSYLRAWEQSVSAIEDGELIEASMQGAEASQRIRRTARVEVRNVVAQDCDAAFDEVLTELGVGDQSSYHPDTCELRSNARLKMGFVGDAAGVCEACDPALRGKYLGNEDHTVRVMLASRNSYVWAFDNAAPLYRVKLILDGDGATVIMLTPPKDNYHEPDMNRVVEFLPWSVLLENGQALGDKSTGENVSNEKLATRAGFFAEVDGAYNRGQLQFHAKVDPSTLSDLIGQPTPIKSSVGKGEGKLSKKAFDKNNAHAADSDVIALEWDSSHPHSAELNPTDVDANEVTAYVYMRIWHIKRSEDPLTIPFSSTRPLARTGLLASFSGLGRAGDYWQATVRTDRRDLILPLSLMSDTGSEPDGPREVIAPLALVGWQSSTGTLHTVTSYRVCRPNLPAITQTGCCRYVVGPSDLSSDFRSIQTAINALPRSGGHICLLPGVYQENISIVGREHICISGCGADTIITNPDTSAGRALVDIFTGGDTRGVILKDFALHAEGQTAVRCSGAGVELQGLQIKMLESDIDNEFSAIQALRVSAFRLRNCDIQTVLSLSHSASVYIDAVGQSLLEKNRIYAIEADTETGNNSLCWGGIQIASGSIGVTIRDNDIRDGRGHGITIGTVAFRATDGTDLGIVAAGFGQCAQSEPFSLSGRISPVDVGDIDLGVKRFYAEPGIAIEDLLIADNHIENFAGSGIGALAPEIEHDLIATRAPLCYRRTTFAVNGMIIRNNTLRNNARGLPGELLNDRTRGGITLSEAVGLSVTQNQIEGNGTQPNAGPICALYLPFGSDVIIDANTLENNGPLDGASVDSSSLRGGICLLRSVQPLFFDNPGTMPTIDKVQLRANVVRTRNGSALALAGGAACSIVGNHFEAIYRMPSVSAIDSGVCRIFHSGRAAESVDLPLGEPNEDRWVQPVGSLNFLAGPAQNHHGIGGLLISNNQISYIDESTAEQQLLVPAFFASTDSVIMSGNQLNATAQRNSILAHCWVIGATINVAHNRIAENVEATLVSLIGMSAMLGVVNDNRLTHYPITFGCENDASESFFVREDNLVWFRQIEVSSSALQRGFNEPLMRLCEQIFEPNSSGPDGEPSPLRVDLFRSIEV